MRKLNKIGVLAVIVLLATNSFAQETVENEIQTRTEVELVFKPIKKVKLSFLPQLRFDEDFSLDKYLFETGLEYKPIKFLELGANYRFVVNPRDSKDTEYFNRFAFSATAKKKFGRFEPSFRLMYSNYADDDVDDKSFLRYRAKVEYDIKKCKITPFAAVQLFQDLNEGGLYKTRYALGADYKLFKKNYLGLSYKFDYYNTDYVNKHIVTIGYKIKF